MKNDSPLALFITWTVYGTFLPGDARGWRHRSKGDQLARPQLAKWHHDRLNHEVILLKDEMRRVVEAGIREICEFRKWTLWAVSVRSNHAHVVVSAPNYKPSLVRDQLKAKATRDLRQAFSVWRDRPVWSVKGDIEFVDTEEDLEQCVIYVKEAQDQKDRDL